MKLGDIVDVGCGHGPEMEIVVLISSGQASQGFDASEWSYLQNGAILQDKKVFGLLHLSEFNHEHKLVQRAQQGAQVDAPTGGAPLS